MDEIKVQLHFSFLKKKKKKEEERKKKVQHIKSRLQAGGASSLTSVGGGRVLAPSSMFTSFELVWRNELVAAPKLSFIALKSRLGKFSAAFSLKSSNPAA